MQYNILKRKAIVHGFLLTALVVLCASGVLSQVPTLTLADEEIEKIKTDLIQTGVLVFDQKGKFVNGLKQDDFELKVDGKSTSVSFFESPADFSSGKNSPASSKANLSVANETVIFFIDDINLKLDSLVRVKRMMLDFFENKKRPDQLCAVFSSSTKVGFLQQLTDDKTVLRAAAERLSNSRAVDFSFLSMTQYEAQLIDKNDREVIEEFITRAMEDTPGITRDVALNMVLAKSRMILEQGANTNQSAYSNLERVIRFTSVVPGRKTILFVSDGFPPDLLKGDLDAYLHRISDAAARVNAVVYSIQAKKLNAEIPEMPEVSLRVQSGERFNAQNGMINLAQATGGKFINNQNDLPAALETALAESSRYYLLAWQPEDESATAGALRKIEISVKNHPEFMVRTQTEYLSAGAKTITERKPPPETADQKLGKALVAPLSSNAVNSSLELHYGMEDDKANLLGILQIDGETLDFTKNGNMMIAKVGLATIIFNSNGEKVQEFNGLISTAYPFGGKPSSRRYNFQAQLKPDLYQVRIAVRDEKSGRIGNRIEWINIPDLKKKELAIGSVLLMKTTANRKSDTVLNDDSDISVDHIFKQSDSMQYGFYIYNAKNLSAPNLTTFARISRNGKLIAQTAETAVEKNEKYPSNLAYASEIPLNLLPIGRYELQIVVNDNAAKTHAEQTVRFEIGL